MAEVRSKATSAALEASYAEQVRRGVLIAIAIPWLVLVLYLPLSLSRLASMAADQSRWFAYDVIFTLGQTLVTIVVYPVLYVVAMRSSRPLRWVAAEQVFNLARTIQTVGFGWIPYGPNFPRYNSVHVDAANFVPFAVICFLTLSSSLLAWAGAAAGVAWTGANLISFALNPEAKLYLGPFGHAGGAKALAAVAEPWTLTPDLLVLQLIALGVFTWLLVRTSQDGRRFVASAVEAEASRSTLARFFPPSVADRIQSGQETLEPTLRSVAVMFVHAPRLAEPDARDLPALLSHYACVERAVFDHHGIVDRFTGGPAMAIFGALGPEAEPCPDALACARDIVRRAGDGVRVSLHFGPAVCGELGGPTSRYFGAAGDVVNVAQRMLRAAEGRGASILATEPFVRALGAAAPAFAHAGAVEIDGRKEPVELLAAQP